MKPGPWRGQLVHCVSLHRAPGSCILWVDPCRPLIRLLLLSAWASLVAQSVVKNQPANAVQSLGREDPLEKERKHLAEGLSCFMRLKTLESWGVMANFGKQTKKGLHRA